MDVPHSSRIPMDPFNTVSLVSAGRLSNDTTLSVPKGSKLSYTGTPKVVI